MERIRSYGLRHKRFWILLAVLAALVVVLCALTARPGQPAAAAAEEIPVFALTRGELRVGLKVSGSIDSGQTAHVTTSLPYPVAEVRVREGDPVSAGDVIAVLDTTELDGRILAARQTWENRRTEAQLAVDQAARHLEDARNQKRIDEQNPQLLDTENLNAVLRQDDLAIENARDALTNAALAQEGISEGDLADLERQREQCTITSPQDGVITSLSAQVGTAGSELAVIEDPGTPVMSVSIREYDINQIRLGQTAEITSGAGGHFTGEVSWIAPRASAGANGETVYPIRLTVLHPDAALRLGMSARADIALETRRDVFVVPLDAVGTDGNGGMVVWEKQTAADGTVALRPIPVTTGLENDIEIEIRSPELAEGMQLCSMAPDGPLPADEEEG